MNNLIFKENNNVCKVHNETINLIYNSYSVAVSCKTKNLQVKQLSCVMHESLIPHDVTCFTENALAILSMALI